MRAALTVVVVVLAVVVSGTAWLVLSGGVENVSDAPPRATPRAPAAEGPTADGGVAVPGRARVDVEQGHDTPRHVILGAQLRDPEIRFADRSAAARVLAGLGDDGVAELLASLGSETETTNIALMALSLLESLPESALPVIARFLREEDHADTAAHVLSRAGVSSVPFALDALGDDRAFVKEAALGVLHDVRGAPREAAEAVARAAADSREDVRVTALWAMRLMKQHAGLLVPTLASALERGGRERDVAFRIITRFGAAASGALPSLTAFLSPSAEDARGETIAALEAMGPAAAPSVPDVLRFAREHPPHSKQAVRVLGAVGPWALRQALTEETGQLRADVTWWIAERGDESLADDVDLVSVLTAGASDADPRVQQHAISALGRFGVTSAADEIASAALSASAGVREAVATALARLRPDDPGAVDVLVRLLGDESRHVRLAAIQALEAFGTRAAPAGTALRALLTSRDDHRAAAARTLGRIGAAASSAREDLILRLQDRWPAAQLNAAIALVRIVPPGSDAHATLRELRVHESDLIRGVLVEELGELPTADLVDILADRLSDRRRGVRELAARSLISWGPVGRAAAPALIERVRTERVSSVLAAVIEALAAVDGDRAAAILVITPWAHTKKSDVAAAAKAALRSLGAE